ncbi:uncharacterized protein LOC123556941 [Mercenaria mercenaria]|uniref:uncharacterized protein LOC123556941 n=1 Tax=Mercenaria mercenaria TaxID=6596 RepID=UPI00234F093F|nr:uncharacterized protein LOC123556941 [Mercenaria mercenaria]
MNAPIICALLCCVSMASGFHLEQREKRSDQEYFINYVSTNGRSANGAKSAQTITIRKKEVQFETTGGMSAVLDFEKMLMTVKNSQNGKVCRSMTFDEKLVPVTFQEIKDALQNQKEFKMPTKTITLNVQLAKDQTQPELSPLSAQLCGGLEVQVLEPKPEAPITALSLAHRRPLRPKREMGWGEFALIVVVCIILL